MNDTIDHKKKQLIKLALAFHDLTAALQACDLMLELKPDLGTPLYDALNNAIVVSYDDLVRYGEVRLFEGNRLNRESQKEQLRFESLSSAKRSKVLG